MNKQQPTDERQQHAQNVSPAALTLAELPIGATATIIGIHPHLRGRKKFADVGLVAGTELLMQAHAPFGGLIRVKVLETSMALHKNDAAHILLQKEEDKHE